MDASLTLVSSKSAKQAGDAKRDSAGLQRRVAEASMALDPTRAVEVARKLVSSDAYDADSRGTLVKALIAAGEHLIIAGPSNISGLQFSPLEPSTARKFGDKSTWANMDPQRPHCRGKRGRR